jgi:hypothetical protein
MLIIPKTTGEPVAFLGEPSAELDAAGAALDEPADVVAPAEPPVLPALDDDEPADELPHAATETAAIAHAPRSAPLLLSCDFISTSLCCSGLRAPGRCLRPCTGKRPTACRRGEYTQLPRVYASHSYVDLTLG